MVKFSASAINFASKLMNYCNIFNTVILITAEKTTTQQKIPSLTKILVNIANEQGNNS